MEKEQASSVVRQKRAAGELSLTQLERYARILYFHIPPQAAADRHTHIPAFNLMARMISFKCFNSNIVQSCPHPFSLHSAWEKCARPTWPVRKWWTRLESSPPTTPSMDPSPNRQPAASRCFLYFASSPLSLTLSFAEEIEWENFSPMCASVQKLQRKYTREGGGDKDVSRCARKRNEIGMWIYFFHPA